MQVEINLPPEVEAKLREDAAARGMTPEAYALQLIEAYLDRLEAEEAAQQQKPAGEPPAAP
jgi:predicted transcriptional regulator